MKSYWMLFVVLLLSACNLSQPGAVGDVSAPTATIERTMVPTPLTDDLDPQPSEALMYSNARYPYAFQHPPDVSVVENPEDGSVIVDDQIKICVSDVNPEAAGSAGDMLIQGASSEEVWKYSARRLTGTALNGPTLYHLERVIISFNTQFYVFTVSEIKYSSVASQPMSRQPQPIAPETLDLFNKILSTVRFPDDRAEDIPVPVKTNAPCP